MKNAKRFAALLLAFVMVMSLAVSASAVNITIDDGDVTGAEYKAFKLLDATNAADINGKGTDKFAYTVVDTYRDVLIDVLELAATATDAEIIAGIEAKRSDIQNFANDLYAAIAEAGIEADEIATNNVFDVEQGYYLIIETKIGEIEGETDVEDVYSLVMLDTAGLENITVQTKEEYPTLDKIIKSDDNKINGDIAEDGKSDNVSVGSYVQFEVTATIPNHAEFYDFYFFIIEDTLSAGLDFVNDEAHPLVVKSGTNTLALNTDYALYTGDKADGATFQVALLNAKAHKGETITVTYWATLNENAVIGEANGNLNTADLTYSNNPNFDYDEYKDPEEPGKPKPKDDEEIPLGDTPDVITRTYTTGIQLMKVDQDRMPLTGAKFKIEGNNVVNILIKEETKFVEDENGAYYKLKDGTYTKQAPTADRYDEITDGTRDGGYVRNNDGTYTLATEEQLQDTSVTLYKYVAGSSVHYVNDGKMYKLEKFTYEIEEPAAAGSYTAEVDEYGYLVLAGLGEGEYTITETVAPDGYNIADPFVVKIEWDPESVPASETNCNWTATINGAESELTINGEGLFEIEVVNRAGAELPETGGIGTTLFYVIGGFMAVAAVVLLVTKKRMAS